MTIRRTLHFLQRCSFGMFVVVLLGSATVLGYSRSQGLMVLSVQTGSMRPGIRPGDAVLVQTQHNQLSVGDIISYHSLQNPQIIITHRIVSLDLDHDRITTKGDALQVDDPVFGRQRIIGVVERTVPLAGYGFGVLRRPVGLVAAVYLPATIIVYGEIRRLSRYYNERHYRLKTYAW